MLTVTKDRAQELISMQISLCKLITTRAYNYDEIRFCNNAARIINMYNKQYTEHYIRLSVNAVKYIHDKAAVWRIYYNTNNASIAARRYYDALESALDYLYIWKGVIV